MKLILDGSEIIECTKVVKGADYIDVYDGDMIISQFGGINDFSGYVLEDGEFSEPEPTKEEILEAKIDALTKLLQDGGLI